MIALKGVGALLTVEDLVGHLTTSFTLSPGQFSFPERKLQIWMTFAVGGRPAPLL